MVLLLAASDSTVEPYESEMGRLVMLDPVDWSSDTLVLVGILCLDLRGFNVFLQLWMASLVFLAANTFVHAAPSIISSLKDSMVQKMLQN